MAINPNFAVSEDAWAPLYGANGAGTPAKKWVDLTGRTRHGTNVRRGKQYELDQTQAAEYSATLDNTDGSLDPLNSAGPWAGGIKPYQPFRHRFMWPPSANRLPVEIASAGEGYPAGPIPASFNIEGTLGTITASIVTLGAGVAKDGANAFSFVVPNATATNAPMFRTDVASVAPGVTYTFSVWVANNTASTTVTLLPYFTWLNLDGSTTFGKGTSTAVVGAAGNPAWSRIVVTTTAPANVAGMRLGMNLGAATTATSTVLVDALQLEVGGSATAYTAPGVWYSTFSGFVERWPAQYTDAGSRGEVVPTAVDAFGLLSQYTLNDAFAEEVNGHSPRFYYPLSEPAGSTVFADQTGTNPPLTVGKAKTGAGSVSAGNAVTATSATGTFTGAPGPVVTISNSNPGTSTSTGGASYLELDASGIGGMASVTSTRMFAFRYTGPTPTVSAALWSQLSGYAPWNLYVGILPSGAITVTGTVGPDGNLTATLTNPSVLDGNWHLMHVVGVPADHANEIPPGYEFYLDGVDVGGFIGVGQLLTPVTSDVYGTSLTAANDASNNFKGDFACLAEFPVPLSATDVTSMYTAWRNNALGESTGSRYARILRYAGFTGSTFVDGGNTQSMGPAALSGADALSALQAVVDTEAGAHWVQGDGSIRFRGRSGRYNAATPALVFGDGPGELPYEDLQLDYDSTHLANIVQVTQTSTGQVFTAQDAASIAAYFPRVMTRSVDSTDPLECQDAANYLLSRYKNPLPRVTALRLHLSGTPGLWAAVLALDLGTRIRVMRRPKGAPAITVDCFVEQMQWDIDDKGGAFVTLQCSPADTTPYATLAAFRTIIYGSTTIAAGTSGIPVAPMLGDNSQQLAALVGHGQRIEIEPGTANAEILTVNFVTATVPGSWNFGNLVMTTPTVFAHAAGSVVRELLPSGQTDPTAWDTRAHLDSIAIAY